MAENNANEVVIVRIFDAPREKVWRAWTDPEQLARWWGPKDFTAPTIKVDFREGGKYLYCMRGVAVPGGEQQNFWSTGIYEKIVPLEKIVTTDSFSDENGNVVPASYYGMPENVPMEFGITITFEDVDGKTKMTLKHVGMPEGGIGDNMETGWSQSFDKMQAIL